MDIHRHLANRIPHPEWHSAHRLVWAGALVALTTCVIRHVAGVHRRRLRETPRALPERLQVWEGEGGQNQLPRGLS
jgi:hypothetical protein